MSLHRVTDDFHFSRERHLWEPLGLGPKMRLVRSHSFAIQNKIENTKTIGKTPLNSQTVKSC